MRGSVHIADAVNWNHPLNRGLVSWWIALPDQQRGSRFRDLCQRHHGTLTNGPAWQSAMGRPGGFGSLGFANTDVTTIRVAVPSLAFTGPPVYVTGWARPAAAGTAAYRAIYGDDGFHPSLLLTGSGFELSYQWEGTGDEYNSGSGLVLTQDAWNFCGLSITASAATLMLIGPNGNLQSWTNTKTHNSYSIGTGAIGADRLNNGHGWTGQLDDVRAGRLELSLDSFYASYRDSLQGYPNTLNYRRRSVVFDMGAGAATISPWHYYQQMMAG